MWVLDLGEHRDKYHPHVASSVGREHYDPALEDLWRSRWAAVEEARKRKAVSQAAEEARWRKAIEEARKGKAVSQAAEEARWRKAIPQAVKVAVAARDRDSASAWRVSRATDIWACAVRP
jgi:hypothetical protein